jgi:hypothetical protein
MRNPLAKREPDENKRMVFCIRLSLPQPVLRPVFLKAIHGDVFFIPKSAARVV